MVFIGEPASRAILRKDDLVQERQTVVSVHDHRFQRKIKLVLKRCDLALEYPVFVIQVRYIGHHEVEFYALLPGLVGLGSNVTHYFGQAPQVLFVRKEEDHHGIGKLSRADSAGIRVSCTGVDQDIVRLNNPFPLFLLITHNPHPSPMASQVRGPSSWERGLPARGKLANAALWAPAAGKDARDPRETTTFTARRSGMSLVRNQVVP